MRQNITLTIDAISNGFVVNTYMGDKGSGISRSDIQLQTDTKFFDNIDNALQFASEFLKETKIAIKKQKEMKEDEQRSREKDSKNKENDKTGTGK